MLLPGLSPNEKWGMDGFTFVPASTIRKGMSANSRAALVIMAGLGFPSGVAGILLRHLHLP
jgi:hypothetical protein